jgi:predicted metal-dependent hydrolase
MANDLADDLVDEEVDLTDEVEDSDTDVSEEEELEFFDIEQFKDSHVRIKVDGEELVVPLSEAVAGYQRNADYTRKTQALAQQKNEIQWANALKGALEHDPAGTIDLLANQFGVQRPAHAAPTQKADPFDSLWGDTTTPAESVDPRYQNLESRLRAFEEAQAQQRLENTISLLSQKYGEEFDANEVVAAALATGSTDLEATFKQIKFDKVMEEAKAAKAAAASKAKKVASKKDAAVVSGGTSRGGSVSDSGSITSIADAWRQAKRELGG